MNATTHCARFKSKHRMSVAQNIVTPNLTSNGNGHATKLQDSLHLPERLPLRVRLRLYVKKEWARVVTKNEQGRYTISQPLALCILGVMLVAGVGAYWRGQDQHDEIIRLQTKLEIQEKSNIDRDSKIDQAAN